MDILKGARPLDYALTAVMVALAAATLVVDATTGLEPVLLALPTLLVVFGIGHAVRHRTAMNAELRASSRSPPTPAGTLRWPRRPRSPTWTPCWSGAPGPSRG